MSSKRLRDTPEKMKYSSVAKKVASEHGDGASPRVLSQGSAGSDGQSTPQWFTLFVQRFEERFSRMEEKMETLLVKRMTEFESKLEENIEKTTACSIQLDEVMGQMQILKKEKEEILEKLDDLENRSRRNNLVFHGVQEVQGEKCEDTVKALLAVSGISADECPVERCHRTPSRSTGVASEKPRIIHVAFSSYSVREKVRKACISQFKQRDFNFKGAKVYVSEDFSKRIMQKRKNKQDDFKRLKSEGKKPFFLFPAKIGVRNSEGKLFIVG